MKAMSPWTSPRAYIVCMDSSQMRALHLYADAKARMRFDAYVASLTRKRGPQ